MRLALAQAELAAAAGEVPVGAVVVQNGQLIASAHNQTRSLIDPTAHAELRATQLAARALGTERLVDCSLICTLEPCAMCVGAIVHARLATLIFAAKEPKTGACGSAFDLLSDPAHGRKISLIQGDLAAESIMLLQQFFATKRL
jgi:tRNA(adenine34) deaminase